MDIFTIKCCLLQVLGFKLLDVATAKAAFKGKRDVFKRKKEKQEAVSKSGAGATPEPSWKWWNSLQFLNPFLSAKG